MKNGINKMGFSPNNSLAEANKTNNYSLPTTAAAGVGSGARWCAQSGSALDHRLPSVKNAHGVLVRGSDFIDSNCVRGTR